MGDAPLNPSRLANGQGFPPPPQPFTICKWTRVGGPNLSRLANGQRFPPPNPSRLANGWAPQPFNGQGFPPPPTLHQQMDKGSTPPQPFTTCKWTRVEPFTTPPPTLHDLQMDKGWRPQPFTTCKWTRVGAPRSCPHYQHCLWTRVGPSTFRDLGWLPI